MKLIVTAKVQGVLEAYKIFIDDEEVAKVRGNNKETTLDVSDEEHTIQLKSMNGKSKVIKIVPEENKNDSINLHFNTHYFKAMTDEYFELVGEE